MRDVPMSRAPPVALDIQCCWRSSFQRSAHGSMNGMAISRYRGDVLEVAEHSPASSSRQTLRTAVVAFVNQWCIATSTPLRRTTRARARSRRGRGATTSRAKSRLPLSSRSRLCSENSSATPGPLVPRRCPQRPSPQPNRDAVTRVVSSSIHRARRDAGCFRPHG